MLLTEDLIESSIQDTREFITPMVSSNRGESDEVLKLDGMLFFDIIVVKILLPILVSITSKLVVEKIQQNNLPYKDLDKAIKALAGREIHPVDKKKKQQLVEIATQQLAKFGASKEQAEALVDLIVKEVQGQGKKRSKSARMPNKK